MEKNNVEATPMYLLNQPSLNHLFVIPDFDTFISGGNLYNRHFIKKMKAEGKHKVDYLTLDELLENPNYRKKIGQVDLLWLDSLYLNPTYVNQVQNYLKASSSKPQLGLLTHHLTSLYPPPNTNASAYFDQNEKPLLIHFDLFWCTSQFTANYLQSKGFDQTKMLIRPPELCFVPPDEEQMQKIEVARKQYQGIRAVIVANVVERKGILPFLQKLKQQIAVKFAKQSENSDWQLWIIGDTTMEMVYAQKCIELVETDEFLHQHITFTGKLPQQTVQDQYAKANLFISTAFMETYGMALQEANAYRLPILALNGGNVGNHIEEGENGFLFQDLEGLVRAFVEWILQNRAVKNF